MVLGHRRSKTRKFRTRGTKYKARMGVVGSIEQQDDTASTAVTCMSAHTLRTDTHQIELENQLRNVWELEAIGIKQESDPVHDKLVEFLTFD